MGHTINFLKQMPKECKGKLIIHIMDKMLFDPFVGGKRIFHYIKSMPTDSYSILTLQKDGVT